MIDTESDINLICNSTFRLPIVNIQKHKYIERSLVYDRNSKLLFFGFPNNNNTWSSVVSETEEAGNGFLLTGESNMTSNLDLSNNEILNLGYPINISDSVSLENINSKFNFAILLTNGIITGNLNMGTNDIINFGDAINDNDAIKLSTINQNLDSFIDKNKDNIMIDGLDMGGNKIINIPNPIQNVDLINLQYLQTKGGEYLKSSGSIFSCILNTVKIINIPYPNSPQNIGTFGYFNNIYNLYILKSGGVITGTLDLQNNLIINVIIPTTGFSIVPKGYFDSFLLTNSSQYINKSGDTLSGILQLSNIINSKPITSNLTGLLLGSQQQDLATKEYVDGFKRKNNVGYFDFCNQSSLESRIGTKITTSSGSVSNFFTALSIGPWAPITTANEWILFKLRTPIAVWRILLSGVSSVSQRMFYWKFEGSQDGTNFTTLYTCPNPTYITLVSIMIDLSSPYTKYKYYRLYIIQSESSSKLLRIQFYTIDP